MIQWHAIGSVEAGHEENSANSEAVDEFASLGSRIYGPDQEWPLMIRAANVQWVNGQTFGLAFFRITETEQQRLGQVIWDLMAGGKERANH